MYADLLWLVPIVVSVALSSIAIFALSKKRSDNSEQDLSLEVKTFNNGGISRINSKPAQSVNELEKRLGELEQSIIHVTHSITNQQKEFEKFRKEETTPLSEIQALQQRLEQLHKEYDLVLRENFTLKAKIRRLMFGGRKANTEVSESLKEKTKLKLYNKAQAQNASIFDDTVEFDIPKFG